MDEPTDQGEGAPHPRHEMAVNVSADRPPYEHRRRRVGRPTADAPVGEVATHRLILRRARTLFPHRGFADVSVGEVALAVGVTKPTLYYHFGNKEALYTAVLCDLMREIDGYIRGTVAKPDSARQRLIELATGYFLHADATMEPMLRDTSELIGPRLAAQVRAAYEDELLAPIEGLMREGMRLGEIRSGDARDLVRALMGLFDAFTDPGGHRARTVEEHQAVAHALISLFLDGAAPRSEEREAERPDQAHQVLSS
ncbi:MAG: TetR/AcrR family transcriptional regulator [Ktedonobacterales bacterium]|nr:TetR/AcrR family transcriptional regulator [Ktedonobacterales bacterium]